MKDPRINASVSPTKVPLTPRQSSASSTTVATVATTKSTTQQQQQRAVCRQYIADRVTGNSHLPREFRRGGSKYGETFYGDDGDDPTDCTNRPPHFLCRVPPCVRRWPALLEQNCVCEWVGKVGFHSYFKNHHVARRRIFFVGFFFNLCALVLTIVAALAFSRDFSILTHTSFSRGWAKIPALSNTSHVTLDWGFRAIARGGALGQEVVTFAKFCDGGDDGMPQDNFLHEVISGEICGQCRSSSQSFVLSCVINIVLILKNMFSDITRMYPKYDLNCPNFAGSLMATMSVFLGLWTIFTYQQRCFTSMEHNVDSSLLWDGRLSGTINAFLIDEDLATVVDRLQGTQVAVHLEWGSGPGLLCLVAATYLKIMDAVCNFIVPTPGITRDLQRQQQYELDYGENDDKIFFNNNESSQTFEGSSLDEEEDENVLRIASEVKDEDMMPAGDLFLRENTAETVVSTSLRSLV